MSTGTAVAPGDTTRLEARSPWAWVPTLSFMSGMPYVAVMTLSVVLYKNLGVSNTDIALYTSWLYLPWVIKPLWSPLVEMFGTRRGYVLALQFVAGVALAAVAFAIPTSAFLQWTLAMFWLLAFASATHDIAGDGLYMVVLPPHHQAAFIAVRSTAYRLAMIAGQGACVTLAGWLMQSSGQPAQAWATVFGMLAALMLAACAYHRFALPRSAHDVPSPKQGNVWGEFIKTFVSFFQRRDIVLVLCFLLLFRLGEAQLLKLAAPFMLDPMAKGGLGLSTQQVGIVYGTIGVIALTLGGFLGSYLVWRFGLKRVLWPLVLSVHAPNLVYIYLAAAQPNDVFIISAAVAFEQFGYGCGFTAFMMYMILVADGPHKTAHYAICTGFMALGMMLPGMVSGWIQEQLGYVNFFVWVCIATVPAIIATAFVKLDPAYGKRPRA
jgi:MFS transporter, PAT family, beta-lactamase induction signal transducer AmpG